MFIVYSDLSMRDFNLKARRLNRNVRAGRYVPSFTVYFGGRPDIDRSSFVRAMAAKGGQFYTDTHFAVVLLLPRMVRYVS
jgi:hypothetical protein